MLDDERWYHSGDYGRIEDGVLWLESRMRDLIIRGGENIYPMEIEHRLIEHPDIADAAVIGVDHRDARPGGQGRRRAAATARHSTRTRCRRGSRQALAAFKVPAYVEFRDALPYTQTGKVMKHLLEREQPLDGLGLDRRRVARGALPRRGGTALRDDPCDRGADRDCDRPGQRVRPARRRGRSGSRAGLRASSCATW